jgi:hypothetical protein
MINPNAIIFSYKDHDIIAFHSIEIEILNKKEIKKIKKLLKNQQKINNDQIKIIINVLKILEKYEDSSLKKKIDYYVFSYNYVPILKIVNKNVIKQDKNFYYKICYLDKI